MAIHTEIIHYNAGDTALEGYLAYDADAEGRAPGVVVFGEWWGRTEYLERRARELAELGYVALAADVYGGGKIAADADEAGQLMNGLLGDMNAVTARVQAAIDTLKAQPQTDTSRMGAMGYCLGGALSLSDRRHRVGAPRRAAGPAPAPAASAAE